MEGFAYRVEVTVRDHAIEEVHLLSVPRISVPTIHQEIMERLKGTHSLPVDTISSATASSKVILKAIENALKR
ncbi:MAG: FMN-binding protein [Candidatus Caldatribacteriaceae bacterium]